MHFPHVTQPFLAIKLYQVVACMKEREKRKKKQRRKGPTRGETKEKWDKPQTNAQPDLLRPRRSWRRKQGTKKKEPTPAPRKKRGKRKRKKIEERKRNPNQWRIPENGKKKNSLNQISKSIQKTHPEPSKTHPTQLTEFNAQNPPQKPP